MGNYKLPEDFFFGAAMSGPETEGAWQGYGKIPNLWDYWSNQNITDFYNLVGSYGGNDFTRRRDEDLAIFKDLGLSSVRTSIQWSRLMNADGKLNPEGAQYYHELFAAFNNVHLKLLANDAGGKSVHFSMLLMHAEDQLLGAETFRIVADDFIDVYEKLAKLEA